MLKNIKHSTVKVLMIKRSKLTHHYEVNLRKINRKITIHKNVVFHSILTNVDNRKRGKLLFGEGSFKYKLGFAAGI